jgi:hypothetical protein
VCCSILPLTRLGVHSTRTPIDPLSVSTQRAIHLYAIRSFLSPGSTYTSPVRQSIPSLSLSIRLALHPCTVRSSHSLDSAYTPPVHRSILSLTRLGVHPTRALFDPLSRSSQCTIYPCTIRLYHDSSYRCDPSRTPTIHTVTKHSSLLATKATNYRPKMPESDTSYDPYAPPESYDDSISLLPADSASQQQPPFSGPEVNTLDESTQQTDITSVVEPSFGELAASVSSRKRTSFVWLPANGEEIHAEDGKLRWRCKRCKVLCFWCCVESG